MWLLRAFQLVRDLWNEDNALDQVCQRFESRGRYRLRLFASPYYPLPISRLAALPLADGILDKRPYRRFGDVTHRFKALQADVDAQSAI